MNGMYLIEFWASIRNYTVLLHDIWMEEKLVGKGGQISFASRIIFFYVFHGFKIWFVKQCQFKIHSFKVEKLSGSLDIIEEESNTVAFLLLCILKATKDNESEIFV